MKLNYGSLAVLITALVFLAFRFRGHPLTAERVAGALLLVPSFVLLVVARLQLGAGFHGGPRSGFLVTTGLYAKVRHPIYLFGSLMLVGIMLYADLAWFLLGVLALVPLKVYLFRREEATLAEHFGAAYTKYKQQTWF
jgi:protein-S-isoprenylcysteine O-methyltransferase Ste14